MVFLNSVYLNSPYSGFMVTFISTTKMKLVDCTRNYRHGVFYETWSTISKFDNHLPHLDPVQRVCVTIEKAAFHSILSLSSSVHGEDITQNVNYSLNV